jgi:site-specific recombinase XerC
MNRNIDLVNRFVESFAAQTQRAYKSDLGAILKELGTEILHARPDDVTRAFFRATEGLSPSSGARRLSAFKAFASWLIRTNRISTNVADGVPAVFVSGDADSNVFPLSATEVDLIITANTARSSRAKYRDEALFITALESGLRRTDLSGMDFEHIDTRGHSAILRLPESRSGIESWVYLTQDAIEQIDRVRTVYGYTSGPIWRSFSNNSAGTRLTAESIYRIVRNLADRAGVARDVTPDLLRLTASYRRICKATYGSDRVAVDNLESRPVSL